MPYEQIRACFWKKSAGNERFLAFLKYILNVTIEQTILDAMEGEWNADEIGRWNIIETWELWKISEERKNYYALTIFIVY